MFKKSSPKEKHCARSIKGQHRSKPAGVLAELLHY